MTITGPGTPAAILPRIASRQDTGIASDASRLHRYLERRRAILPQRQQSRRGLVRRTEEAALLCPVEDCAAHAPVEMLHGCTTVPGSVFHLTSPPVAP